MTTTSEVSNVYDNVIIYSLRPACLLLGSGVNTDPSTALEITDTFVGSIADRSTVFSLLETQISI